MYIPQLYKGFIFLINPNTFYFNIVFLLFLPYQIRNLGINTITVYNGYRPGAYFIFLNIRLFLFPMILAYFLVHH